jgi:hypothetical protein
MLVSDLTETRAASLYHGCGLGGALQIIARNTLEDRTQHELAPGSEPVTGTSLSRSLRVAWGFGDVVFEFDQTRLRQRFRLIPVDYWHRALEPDLTGVGRRRGKYAEAEEFLIGPLTNVMRYVTAIHMTPQRLAWAMKYHQEQSQPLLTHPLLKVIE